MHGALALSAGVLFVGRSAKTATIQAFDLDGRVLRPGFEFRDEALGRSSVAGLALDDDRRVWVADSAARKVRGFTVFGRPIAELGGRPEDQLDARGALGSPIAVRARGGDERLLLLVASGGQRRHALQFLRPLDGRQRSLRSLGEAEGTFDDLADVHWASTRELDPAASPARTSAVGDTSDDGAENRADDFVLACERRARRLQVFRGATFHYAFRVPGRPEAAVRLADGRCVVALGQDELTGEMRNVGGVVLLLGPDGRVLRTLAGPDELEHPTALVALPGATDDETRVWVLDREGSRVQLFTLDGRGWGQFPSVVAL